MATDRTEIVRARVPVEIADALRVDASELKLAPGTLVRQILEGRYSLRSTARNADMSARKSDSRPRGSERISLRNTNDDDA